MTLREGSYRALVDTVDSTAAVFCNLIGNQRILTWVTSCHNSKHQIGQLGSQLFSENTQNFLLKISIYLLWKWLSWGFMGIHLISFYWLLTKKLDFTRWADKKIQHRTTVIVFHPTILSEWIYLFLYFSICVSTFSTDWSLKIKC